MDNSSKIYNISQQNASIHSARLNSRIMRIPSCSGREKFATLVIIVEFEYVCLKYTWNRITTVAVMMIRVSV